MLVMAAPVLAQLPPGWSARPDRGDVSAVKFAAMGPGFHVSPGQAAVLYREADKTGGKFHSVISGDYKNAININSRHKAAARAWIDWFADESNYAVDQGGVPPLISGAMPGTLKDFTDIGVEFMELTPAPKGQEGLVNRIDSAAEIGMWDPKYRQRLVDAARGAKKETKDAIFADLNKKWAAARAKTT